MAAQPFFYPIIIPDAALVASLQAQFPNGITGAPATIAVTYNAPLGAQAPPQTVLLPPYSIIPGVSSAVAGGTLPNGWTDQFGVHYPPTDWIWVGFFLVGGLTGTADAPPLPSNKFHVKVGGYLGNAQVRTIPVGFDMSVSHAAVFVKPVSGAGGQGAYRNTGMTGASPINGSLVFDAITALGGTGFTLGVDANAYCNGNNILYGYIALADAAGSYLRVGNYVGVGNTSISVTGVLHAFTLAAAGFTAAMAGCICDFVSQQYVIVTASPTSVTFNTEWLGAGGTVIGTVLGDNRTIIVRSGWQPSHAWVNGFAGIYGSRDFPGNESLALSLTATNPRTTAIKSFVANGFVVGTSGDVNGNTFNYYWMALRTDAFLATLFQSGKLAPAVGSDTIAGLPFQPGWVTTQQSFNNTDGVWRAVNVQPKAGSPVTESTGWGPDGGGLNVVDFAANGITGLTGNGFTTGAGSTPAGRTVYWFAFAGDATLPPVDQGPLTGTCPINVGTVGQLYSGLVAVTGGTPPYTWVLTLGQLPPGTSLNLLTGEIRGIPTTVGTYNFTITLNDSTLAAESTCSCSITISPAATAPNPEPPVPPTPQPTPPVGPFPSPPVPPFCVANSIAIQTVAARLQDPGMVHWTAAEIQLYLNEALRVYNAYTLRYRNQGTFTTSNTFPFYELPDMLPWLRGYNVLDTDLVTEMQYHLMEPPTPTLWSGSSQFTLNEVTVALQTRRDQFLRETGAVLQYQVYAVVPDATGRVALPSNVLHIRRAAWIMQNGTVVPLKKEDEWNLTHFQPAWVDNFTALQPTEPTDATVGYSVNVTPPLIVQLAPPPINAGSLALVVTTIGAALAPATGVLMGVPDDWAWVVKWGAMADLLSTAGLPMDPERAAYAQARWQYGIKLARQASVVLDGRVDGVVTRLNSLMEADQYRRAWQSLVGAPTRILTVGHNLAILAPPPNAGPYTILLDVVANMPVSLDPTFCINTGIDLAALDAIYDYAQHLALFKEGPEQLAQSKGLYDRFAGMCGMTEALDEAAFPQRGPVLQQTVQEPRVNPHLKEPEETES